MSRLRTKLGGRKGEKYFTFDEAQQIRIEFEEATRPYINKKSPRTKRELADKYDVPINVINDIVKDITYRKKNKDE